MKHTIIDKKIVTTMLLVSIIVFIVGCEDKNPLQKKAIEEAAERNYRQNESDKKQETKSRKAWLEEHELIDDNTPLGVGASVCIKIDGFSNMTATISDITDDGKLVTVLWAEVEWIGEYRHERRTIKQHKLNRELVQRPKIWVKKGTSIRVEKPF